MSGALQAEGNSVDTIDICLGDCPVLFLTLKDWYVLDTTDGRHGRFCDLYLSAESNKVWAGECLHVLLNSERDKKLLTS